MGKIDITVFLDTLKSGVNKAAMFNKWSEYIEEQDIEEIEIMLGLFSKEWEKVYPFTLFLRLSLEHRYCELNMQQRRRLIFDVPLASPECIQELNDYLVACAEEMEIEVKEKLVTKRQSDDLLMNTIQKSLSVMDLAEIESHIQGHAIFNAVYDTALIHRMRGAILQRYEELLNH
jgi:hypothetical protein